MLLVCDVGNTNIVMGVYRGQELLRYWRISTDKTKTSDEIGIIVHQFFKNEGIPTDEIEDVIISSVVPTIMYSLQHMAIKYFDKEALVVGPGIKTGINIKYDNPRQVGADRIVNGCMHTQIRGTVCYSRFRYSYNILRYFRKERVSGGHDSPRDKNIERCSFPEGGKASKG